jgi:restriction endonuclease S subunit
MITKTKYYTIEIPCPPLPIQQEVLAILNDMEAELKAIEQMAAKAEQRAKFILDGHLSCQSNPDAISEVNNKVIVTALPVNEIVETSDTPKAKRILKIKKESSN